MLAELRRIVRDELPVLLADPATPWQTLDVLYETPRVERVWLQRGENRLYMHRIHPCDKAFFHPHPWPSAILGLGGHYLMHIGYGPPDGAPPPIAATIDICAGAGYEMLDPWGWHDVSPYGGPSLSLMLTGPVWTDKTLPHAQKAANGSLTDAARDDILAQVRKALGLPEIGLRWTPGQYNIDGRKVVLVSTNRNGSTFARGPSGTHRVFLAETFWPDMNEAQRSSLVSIVWATQRGSFALVDPNTEEVLGTHEIK